jgi:hypothetical protein
MCAAAILSVVPGLGVPAGHGIALLPDVPDGQCRDGGPERLAAGLTRRGSGRGCPDRQAAVRRRHIDRQPASNPPAVTRASVDGSGTAVT